MALLTVSILLKLSVCVEKSTRVVTVELVTRGSRDCTGTVLVQLAANLAATFEGE